MLRDRVYQQQILVCIREWSTTLEFQPENSCQQVPTDKAGANTSITHALYMVLHIAKRVRRVAVWLLRQLPPVLWQVQLECGSNTDLNRVIKFSVMLWPVSKG